MFCVGLTGRVGSGKSTAAMLFQTLHVPIISADQINQTLLQPGGAAYVNIKSHFGPDILLPDHSINKRLLRQRMTDDPSTQHWLEEQLHPLIHDQIQKQINQLSQAPYCIIEIPLLIDKMLYPYLDRVLLIDSEEPLQLDRLMQRDHTTLEEAQALIGIQASREDYVARADDIIVNNGSIETLEAKIRNLHQQYTRSI